MPSNLYGVANAPNLLQLVTAADVGCPAGAITNIASVGPLIAPSAGWYYPFVSGMWVIQFGASIPGNLYLGFRIGAGTVANFGQILTQLMPVSGYGTYSYTLIGAASTIPWTGAGSIINLTVNPLVQAVTYSGYTSQWVVGLIRAPDQ